MNEQFSKIEGHDIKNALINLQQLIPDVTDICNLRCKYYGYGDLYQGHNPRGTGAMTLNKACTILDYLAKLWMLIAEFKISFQVILKKENRWIKLGNSVPWGSLTNIYYRSMSIVRRTVNRCPD